MTSPYNRYRKADDGRRKGVGKMLRIEIVTPDGSELLSTFKISATTELVASTDIELMDAIQAVLSSKFNVED
jgi:hypothetical protein